MQHDKFLKGLKGDLELLCCLMPAVHKINQQIYLESLGSWASEIV